MKTSEALAEPASGHPTYAQQLLDPRWKTKRATIIERDGHRCQHCDQMPQTLHVHHITYYGGLMAWEYPDRLLITLCDQCHDKEHRLMKDAAIRIVAALRRAGADNQRLDKISLLLEEICDRDIAPAVALMEIEIALHETWGRQRP